MKKTIPLCVACLLPLTFLFGSEPTPAKMVQSSSDSTTGYSPEKFFPESKRSLIAGKLATVSNDPSYGPTADFNADSIPSAIPFTDSSAIQNAALTDGKAPVNPLSGSGDGNMFAGVGSGLVLTYKLDKPSTVTEVDTFSGWQDQGRVNQTYILSYSTDNGATYSKVVEVNGTPKEVREEPYTIKVALTGTLKNVTNVRFTFKDTQNDGVGMTEIVVIGAPASGR